MLRQTFLALLITCSAAAVRAETARDGVPAAAATRFEQMLDLRSNAGMARSPRQALDLADAMTDPEFLVAAMVLSANPEIWLKAMERAGAPQVPKNIAQAATPEVLAEWFYSSIDPKFQQAILSRMLDPKKPQRWMQAMSDPRFFMPALAVVNPATPAQWMKVTADGRMIQPMRPWLDPKTYLNWMRLPMPAVADRPGENSSPPQRY